MINRGSNHSLLTLNHSPETLPGQDSNLGKQNQNLLCYRYTTGQKSCLLQGLAKVVFFQILSNPEGRISLTNPPFMYFCAL